MDRLAKKCVIASGLFHGTLLVLLLVGPAFLASNEPPQSKDIIDFIPSQIIEANMTGGGNPNVATPPSPRPAPPVPQPQPQPEPVRQPEPEPVRQPKPQPQPEAEPRAKPPEVRDPDAIEPAPKPRKPQVSLKPVVRKPGAETDARAKAEAAREKAQAAAAAREARKKFSGALSSIRNNTGGKVEIGDVAGPGGGGPSYASFESVLRSIYFNNWREPSDATVEDAVVKATVTIASDGTVISARVTRGSGDAAVDRSVQRLLEDVTFIAPFPAGAKEKQRTYPLSFSLKAKRGNA
jgi:TonB family protein